LARFVAASLWAIISAGDGGEGGFNIDGSKSGIAEKSMNPCGWEEETEVGEFAGGTDSKYMDQSSFETPIDSDCCKEACKIVVGNDGEGAMTLGCVGCDNMSRSCKN